ncbi:M23 family metallopeptidase [Bacillus wiedmannii]|uniref:M23 family metallopeptidase n=1 Tax=Bacillus wiedmannii TaxID=1890302 RepID=UPI0034D5AD28
MPYQYQRTPFNPPMTEPVRMYQGCHGQFNSAKDIGFYNSVWGVSVYAVEDGTVVYTKGDSNCKSPIINSTSANPDPAVRNPPGCLTANLIAIRGNDGFFTEYVHVVPRDNLSFNSVVKAGDFIGTVDNSAQTSGPHVHLTRYYPNTNYIPGNSDYWQNGGTCNWTMFNVIGITPTPIRNGWVEDEAGGNWYYYVNAIRQTNKWVLTNNVYYQLDSTGVWTGSYYYFDTAAQKWYWWNNFTQTWYYWNGTAWIIL